MLSLPRRGSTAGAKSSLYVSEGGVYCFFSEMLVMGLVGYALKAFFSFPRVRVWAHVHVHVYYVLIFTNGIFDSISKNKVYSPVIVQYSSFRSLRHKILPSVVF